MSLILDALRKSEAQRRRGELPALSLELPPATTRPAPSRAWWIALPVGIALAALAIWLIGPHDTTPPEPRQVEAAGPITRDAVAAEAATPDAEGAGAAGEGFAGMSPRPAANAGRRPSLACSNPSPAAPAPAAT